MSVRKFTAVTTNNFASIPTPLSSCHFLLYNKASIVFKTGSSALLLRVKARHTTPYDPRISYFAPTVLRAKTKTVKKTKAFVAEKKFERRWPRPLITEGHVQKQKIRVFWKFLSG